MTKEDEKKRFRDLATKYELTKDDFWSSPQGFVIISRRGIEKIQSKMGAEVTFEVVPEFTDVSESKYVVQAEATVKINQYEEKFVQTYGESSPKNTRGGAQAYPVAMAEKRALSRAILKLSDFYQLNVFSEDEVDDNKDT
jgi:hypothetical protein